MSALVGYVVGLLCGLVIGGLGVILIYNRETRGKQYPAE